MGTSIDLLTWRHPLRFYLLPLTTSQFVRGVDDFDMENSVIYRSHINLIARIFCILLIIIKFPCHQPETSKLKTSEFCGKFRVLNYFPKESLASNFTFVRIPCNTFGRPSLKNLQVS